MIPYNKPYITGKELEYVKAVMESGYTAGHQKYSKLCETFFTERYGFKNNFLTTSCSAALDMSAILGQISPGDEVIMPSYTFTSTANAFALRGATIRFADSMENHPNMDVSQLSQLINEKTKAMVIVHYAGVACEMDAVMELFHETKNIASGEGGMLILNEDRFLKRAEQVYEKGTNRAAFFRGETQKYEWVDVGSSFVQSDLLAAYLYAQLEELETIQNKRLGIWNKYDTALRNKLGTIGIGLPEIPDYATNNAHIYYLVCRNKEERKQLIDRLKENGIMAVFHYQSLHKSPFYKDRHDGRDLPNADRFTDCLLRLPLFVDLSDSDQAKIIEQVLSFY